MGGKQVGQLELVGHPDGDDWRLRRLSRQPDGSLAGDGMARRPGWHENPGRSVAANQRAGKSRRVVSTVRAAAESWRRICLGQAAIQLCTLDGLLKLDTTRAIPQNGSEQRNCSTFSAAGIAKRITLDFTDVQRRFQFDNINGNATIRHM
jgi:hypothetical protein